MVFVLPGLQRRRLSEKARGRWLQVKTCEANSFFYFFYQTISSACSLGSNGNSLHPQLAELVTSWRWRQPRLRCTRMDRQSTLLVLVLSTLVQMVLHLVQTVLSLLKPRWTWGSARLSGNPWSVTLIICQSCPCPPLHLNSDPGAACRGGRGWREWWERPQL